MSDEIKAIDIAHMWLKKSREEANGPMSQWTPEEMDRYHTDLGLLVDFATDCWPTITHPHRAEEGE